MCPSPRGIVGCIPSTCPHCGYGPVGLFVGLETKMPGNKPTALQEHTLSLINAAGGAASVVYSAADAETAISDRWLRQELNRPA
jgi:hypothetical protein